MSLTEKVSAYPTVTGMIILLSNPIWQSITNDICVYSFTMILKGMMNRMKFGMRKPSLAKSFSSRTKGRATRTIKKALIPGYGKKSMGILHPKKALYNKVYHKTSFSIFDLFK